MTSFEKAVAEEKANPSAKMENFPPKKSLMPKKAGKSCKKKEKKSQGSSNSKTK